ncbi:MAG: hypothetical protein IPP74_12610 [Alphaproteobacteria bacterium]|nr:hypothetical protein [Alphaproteobacteria bacterium]
MFILGIPFENIPASIEILCFLMGLNLFAFSINALDLILLSRIRYTLVSNYLGPDLVNLATAHLKGNGLWVDIITPKLVGYCSGKSHGVFSNFIFFILIIFYIAVLISSSASLVSLYIQGFNDYDLGFNWSVIISTSGTVMGLLGVFLIIAVHIIPFKYKISEDINLNEINS